MGLSSREHNISVPAESPPLSEGFIQGSLSPNRARGSRPGAKQSACPSLLHSRKGQAISIVALQLNANQEYLYKEHSGTKNQLSTPEETKRMSHAIQNINS